MLNTAQYVPKPLRHLHLPLNCIDNLCDLSPRRRWKRWIRNVCWGHKLIPDREVIGPFEDRSFGRFLLHKINQPIYVFEWTPSEDVFRSCLKKGFYLILSSQRRVSSESLYDPFSQVIWAILSSLIKRIPPSPPSAGTAPLGTAKRLEKGPSLHCIDNMEWKMEPTPPTAFKSVYN